MTIPRAERLRITQDVYRKWQDIYGDRVDAEAEAANWEMLRKALEEAEERFGEDPAK